MFPPSGLFGGGSAGGSVYLKKPYGSDTYKQILDVVEGAKSPTKFSDTNFRKGDRIMILSPGGGGYGNPKNRNVETIQDDLMNGYISLEEAVNTYDLPREVGSNIIDQYWFNRDEREGSE